MNAESRRKLEDYKVPDVRRQYSLWKYRDCTLLVAVCTCIQVMEYVQERASLYELTKAVKAWERKVEISEVINKLD